MSSSLKTLLEQPEPTPPAGSIADAIASIVSGKHGDPFGVLGPHESPDGVVVRLFCPGAAHAWILEGNDEHPCRRLHSDGFFEADLPGRRVATVEYRVRCQYASGSVHEFVDPYSLPSILGEMDLHLLGEGTHTRSYDRLGAHVREIKGVRGVSFAVWAPSASRVSVVGDFNQWDGRRHLMRKHPGVGVWDVFIPGLDQGERYKFEIIGPDGVLLPLRTDPHGFFFELRPQTAAVVHSLGQYEWRDEHWMQERAKLDFLHAPTSIYEVHLGSWRRDPSNPERLLSYGELADQLIPYVQDMGFTHIELLPITEHPFDGSWGYQTLGYFAPTSRYGTPEDFMAFVDRCHQSGVGVLIDWVPAHFPRDEHGLRYFDGSALYEHQDPRQGEHPDWGTMVFNFGRNEVANFLTSSALFWLEHYHIDGLRVDAVASMLYLDYGRKEGEWIPNRFGGRENLEAIDFLKRLNELIHGQFPGVMTMAEESTAWPMVSRPTYVGGLGFSLKWNMGWMNDTLRYFHRDPVYRKYHQHDLTFSLMYAFSENFLLPLSHDEVVHGKGSLVDKMPGDLKQHFANLRLLLGYMYAHPGRKLLFMGGEFGQWSEWKFDRSLDWHLLQFETHQGVQQFVRDLNRLHREEPALHELDFDWAGFQWIDLHDHEGSTLVFLRRGKREEDYLIFACNFTPVARTQYRIGVPELGYFREILNSDSAIYDGANLGNAGGASATDFPWHDRPFSLEVTLPALSVVCFKPTRG